MLYDFFSLFLYIIEDLNKFTRILYASMFPSVPGDNVYKSEGSSNNDKGKGKAIEMDSESDDQNTSEQEPKLDKGKGKAIEMDSE
jgi:hypothetical protein